jgi:hypothetical protein
MRALVQIDFVRPMHRYSVLGALLLALGLISAAAVGLEYHELQMRRAALELRLAASVLSQQRVPHDSNARVHETDSSDLAARELATPWTALLAQLERASQDSSGQIAVLGVEPDHAKHRVHIIAEAADLALALAYVQRLQASPLLRFPMLDSHELRRDDAQHPVRFELSSEWRDTL